MSPSMWACFLDHIEHFKLLANVHDSSLVKLKIDEKDVDNDGRTWIHWSVRKNEPLKCLKVKSPLIVYSFYVSHIM
jgi:hypothetical protein